MKRWPSMIAMAAVVMISVRTARADHYAVIDLANLVEARSLPRDWGAVHFMRVDSLVPWVTMEGSGAAYLGYDLPERWPPLPLWDTARIAVEVDAPRPVRGRVYLPDAEWSRLRAVDFAIEADAFAPQPPPGYQRVKLLHYERLVRQEVSGTAWFRHQAAELRKTIAEPDPPAGTQAARRQDDELAETFDLFTGLRAASENMAVDQVLLMQDETAPEATVNVATLEGISIEPYDFSSLIEGVQMTADPLAAYVPADQYVFFFPDTTRLFASLDELSRYGSPVIQRAGAANMMTRERYLRQLGIDMEMWRASANQLDIKQIALTGSDTYFGSGTDVAVLLATGAAEPILQLLDRATAGDDTLAHNRGTLRGVPYQSAIAPDGWSVRMYRTVLDDRCIVLSNSRAQLEHIIAVFKGDEARLADLDEYTFMRHRYTYGDADEAVLLLVTDDAIRRLGSARWRIGQSRRIRMLAAMETLQARYLDELVQGTVEPRVLDEGMAVPGAGEVQLTVTGVRSSVFGRSPFLTPIRELPINMVTQAEMNAYNRWRQRYENQWSQQFDPIAMRLSIREDAVGMDLTVLPLHDASEYRQIRELAGESRIKPGAGDPHAEAMLHYVMAMDINAPLFNDMRGMAQQFINQNPFAWIGSSIAIYMDEDPFWEELAQAEDAETFVMQNANRMPLAVHFEVKDPLRLAGFLTALRAMVQQTAPNMVHWESREHNEQPYICIRPVEPMGDGNYALYYATSPRSFTIALNEMVLHRAMNRHAAQVADGEAGLPEPAVPVWWGDHLNLRADRRIVPLFALMAGDDMHLAVQTTAWKDLPILNEWRQRYPERDPVELHQRIWGVHLTDPTGQNYTWDAEHGTMSSPAYGHSGKPRDGSIWPPFMQQIQQAAFGLTFEHDGLRAKAQLQREAN